MKLILKSLTFILILLVLYLATVFAFSRIGSGASTVMKIATRNPVTPGVSVLPCSVSRILKITGMLTSFFSAHPIATALLIPGFMRNTA